jgi:ADP-heptose:LPS heptosyltransferase
MSGYLIIRLKGLGDIVHLIPSITMIREREPDAPIGLVCQKPFGQIIPPSLNVDLYELSSGAGVVETFKLIKAIRRKKYSKLFDLFGNPRTAVLSIFSGIKERYGFDYRIRRNAYTKTFSPTDPNKHLLHLFNEFFNYFGIEGKVVEPHLKFQKSSVEKIKAFLAIEDLSYPILAINPHTTYPSKKWPEEHFIKFLKLWHSKTGKRAIITWGPGEESDANKILRSVGKSIAVLQPEVNIQEFASLLAAVDVFLTADTGPMNIAWSVKTNVVALFGPTTRRAVAPRGDKDLVLYRDDLDCLECHQEVCDHRSCLNGMKPEWVFKKIEEKFPEYLKKNE